MEGEGASCGDGWPSSSSMPPTRPYCGQVWGEGEGGSEGEGEGGSEGKGEGEGEGGG